MYVVKWGFHIYDRVPLYVAMLQRDLSIHCTQVGFERQSERFEHRVSLFLPSLKRNFDKEVFKAECSIQSIATSHEIRDVTWQQP